MPVRGRQYRGEDRGPSELSGRCRLQTWRRCDRRPGCGCTRWALAGRLQDGLRLVLPPGCRRFHFGGDPDRADESRGAQPWRLAVGQFRASTGFHPRRRPGADLPCSLLSEENTCLVYAARPLTYRTLPTSNDLRCEYALKSAACDKADVFLKSYGVLQLVGCARRASINVMTRELGLQHDHVSLVSALFQISDDKGNVECLMAGERMFTPRAGLCQQLCLPIPGLRTWRIWYRCLASRTAHA